MDANKVEVSEAFIVVSLKHECLWDVKARAYNRNARENALLEIILHSQSFTQTVLGFIFRSVFFLFGIITMAVAVAAKLLTHCTFS